MVSVLKMKSFLFFIMAISVTNCQNDELEIDICFGYEGYYEAERVHLEKVFIISSYSTVGKALILQHPMCKYTRGSITEEVSKEISVEVLIKFKDSVNETGDDIQEPGTCVIR